MAYHFIIHTKGFVPFQWSEENTDGLRRNAVITAMDGLKFRESSEKALALAYWDVPARGLRRS